MNSPYRCVVNNHGEYQNFVILGSYAPAPDEQLLDVSAPTLRMFAGCTGFIRPSWDGGKWVETASQEEITVWEQAHPNPDELHPKPLDRLDVIEAQVSYTAMMTGTEIGG